MIPDLDAVPDVLTVEEAAQILRIGRNSAYALARQWLVTGGAEGVPAIRLGRCIRVPRTALEQLLGCELTMPNRDPGTVIPVEQSHPASTM